MGNGLMKSFVAMVSVALASCMACAAVSMGENMIVNGRLELEQVEIPLHWEPSASAQVGKDMLYESSGGPNGIPCARFVNNGDKPKSFILRQYRYTLVPGAKYRLSAQIRTRGFSGDGGLLVVNAGWRKTVGITGFAANSDWKFRTQDVIAPESTDLKVYSVAIHLDSFRGEIAFADLKLEPLDEAACAGSDMPAGGDSDGPALLPVESACRQDRPRRPQDGLPIHRQTAAGDGLPRLQCDVLNAGGGSPPAAEGRCE
jgi:hypothetical protein